MKHTITEKGKTIGELASSIVPRVGEVLEISGTVCEVVTVTYVYEPEPGAEDDLAEIVVRVTAREAHPDDLAVDTFAAAMKEKLARSRAKGRSGWNTDKCNSAYLSRLLREHVEKGDPVDVANFCMMLGQRAERIVALAPDPSPSAKGGDVGWDGTGPHPSHATRYSDSSLYDEVCKNCGATDIAGGGWGKLAEPCPKYEAIRMAREAAEGKTDTLREAVRISEERAARAALTAPETAEAVPVADEEAERAAFDAWWTQSGRKGEYDVLAGQAAYIAWLERAAMGTDPAPATDDREMLVEALPKLDDGLIRAALEAHYGKKAVRELGIMGVDLTAGDVNWPFGDGFRRMWAGIRKELKRRAALATEASR